MSQSLATTNGHIPTTTNNLTLAQCEGEILAANAEMQEAQDKHKRRVGLALWQIDTGRLYREWVDTFEEYVEQRWHMPSSTAYEWIAFAKVSSNIEAYSVAYRVVIEPVEYVSHAKELKRLDDGDQAPALIEARKLAADRGRSEATHYDVRRVVMARLNEPAPLSPADTQHNRYQAALAAHIRRQWPCLDPDKRTALLAELAILTAQLADGINPEADE
jgi:hypothetical protein